MQLKKFDKSGELLETVGTIDELMAVLGVVMTQLPDKEKKLRVINSNLFSINSSLVGFENKVKINIADEVKKLEKEILEIEKKLGSAEKFLEIGGELDLWLNWARTVARRVERRVVSLSKEQEVDKNVLVYLNRLSSYLFTLGRMEEEG